MYTRRMGERGRPATGTTRHKSMRIPDGVWRAAKAKAAAEGRTVTDVVTELLQRYISSPPKPH
jgi:hypothetical protein